MSNNGISQDSVEIGYVNGTYFLTDEKSIVYLDEFGNAYDQYFYSPSVKKGDYRCDSKIARTVELCSGSDRQLAILLV